jgi:hypothetical protein
VHLASRGLRDLDTGEQKIGDSKELAQVRAQARKVNLKSLIAAFVLTALSFVVPL